MGIAHDWVAINEVVEAALRDANVLEAAPTTEEELGYGAETVTEYLVAALVRGDLAKRATWWKSESPDRTRQIQSSPRAELR